VPVVVVGYVTSGPATAPLLDALDRASQEFGWNYQTAPQGSADSVQAFAAGGAAVVVVDGADLAAAAEQAARDNPSAYVISLNPHAAADLPPNLLVLGGPGARVDQVGFMAGVTAGLATNTKNVTVIGDPNSIEGLSYSNGFLHGVRYACPRCRVLTIDVRTPEDGTEASAQAVKYEALRSDVFFAAAGGAGDVALVAAAQAGGFALGSGGDVYLTRFSRGAAGGAERVLTSVYFDEGAAVYAALAAFHAGAPPLGRLPLAAATGALIFAPFRDAAGRLTDLERADLAAVLARLSDGSLDTGIDPASGEEY
jgi:basic membrane lipoprotein Med (substrate-binding protein (PBP1-ABC) superfamily)